MSIQNICISILVILNGNFEYFNPILGNIDIQEAITVFATTIVLLKGFVLLIFPKNLYNYQEQVAFYCKILPDFPLLRWISVSIWQIYIIDIYLGHTALALPINLLVVNFGAMAFIIPFLTRPYRRSFWILLILASPFALASGSRGPLMFPIVFYLLGALTKQNFNLRYVVKLIFLLIPIAIGSSLLGVARYAARFGTDQTFLGQLNALFTAASEILNQDYSLMLFVINTFSDRLVQWPVLVALQEQLITGVSIPFSWLEEFRFSFSVSGTTNNSVELQQKILDSGMLYGLVKALGYDPSVGWTVPVNFIVEFTLRAGVIGFIFAVALPVLLLRVFYSLKRNKLTAIIILCLPGLLLFRIPETHTVYLVKQLVYMITLIIILYSVEKTLPKKSKYYEA